jgi:hypothetical protein
MTSLVSRLAKLERAQAPGEHPPVRIFHCDGSAQDAGPSFADSPRPPNEPAGFIWAMSVCGCAAERLSGCCYRDADDPERFTITMDRRADLTGAK